MHGFQKQYFVVFCLILAVALSFLMLGVWEGYREMLADETSPSQFAKTPGSTEPP